MPSFESSQCRLHKAVFIRHEIRVNVNLLSSVISRVLENVLKSIKIILNLTLEHCKSEDFAFEYCA